MSNPWNVQLTLVGTNHKHAPIEVRERLWCRAEILPNRLKSILQDGNEIREAVILSTCNRTEIYTVSSSKAETISTYLKKAMSEWSGIEPADIERYVYVLTGESAVHHLISVMSGLDSLAVGEGQIQEQVGQAVRIASRAETTGRFLTELFQYANRAADDIRALSGLETEQVSVSSAVTFMLRELARKRQIQTILLVGAGKMISLAAKDLHVFPGLEVWVANRTLERASDLAARIGGKPIELSGIPVALETADVVLTCTSADDYVIGADELRAAVGKRRDKELIVIDVAVPRNVNPIANLIPGLKVYDIDDLAPFVKDSEKAYRPKIMEAERLAREQTQNFYTHIRAYDANDTLRDLRKVAEDIREKELARALRKLGDIPSRERTIVDLLTRRIVNKLLYEPTLKLKEHATNGDGVNYEALIRELFDIGRQDEQ